MDIGMSRLHHKGFTGLSRLLHEISGVSVMTKSACETHGNKRNTSTLKDLTCKDWRLRRWALNPHE